MAKTISLCEKCEKTCKQPKVSAVLRCPKFISIKKKNEINEKEQYVSKK